MFKVLVAFFSFLSIAKVSSQELFDAFEPSMHITDSSVSDIIDDSITVVQYYDVNGNPVSYVEYYPNGKMRTYFSATKGMAKENLLVVDFVVTDVVKPVDDSGAFATPLIGSLLKSLYNVICGAVNTMPDNPPKI